MTRHYTFRIMIASEGHSPTELFRSSERYTHQAWSHWTRNLSGGWHKWTEHTLADRQCISDRPKIRAPHVAPNAERLRLYPVNPHQEEL